MSLEDEELREKQEEKRMETLQKRVENKFDPETPKDRFLKRNPHLIPHKSALKFLEGWKPHIGRCIYKAELDIPRKELIDSDLKKLSKFQKYHGMPELNYSAYHKKYRKSLEAEVERRIMATDPEDKPVEVTKASDKSGELYLLEEGEFVCRECGSFKEKIRIDSKDRLICDSCFKMSYVVDGLEDKTEDKQDSTDRGRY